MYALSRVSGGGAVGHRDSHVATSRASVECTQIVHQIKEQKNRDLRFPSSQGRTPLPRSVLQDGIRRVYDLPLPKRKSTKVPCVARVCALTEKSL